MRHGITLINTPSTASPPVASKTCPSQRISRGTARHPLCGLSRDLTIRWSQLEERMISLNGPSRHSQTMPTSSPWQRRTGYLQSRTSRDDLFIATRASQCPRLHVTQRRRCEEQLSGCDGFFLSHSIFLLSHRCFIKSVVCYSRALNVPPPLDSLVPTLVEMSRIFGGRDVSLLCHRCNNQRFHLNASPGLECYITRMCLLSFFDDLTLSHMLQQQHTLSVKDLQDHRLHYGAHSNDIEQPQRDTNSSCASKCATLTEWPKRGQSGEPDAVRFSR
jgi:hypothetical protein